MQNLIFTEKEQEAAKTVSQNIDFSKTEVLLQYGGAAQKCILDFSQGVLEAAKTKDFGECMSLIGRIFSALNGFEKQEDQRTRLASFFRKKDSKPERFDHKCSDVSELLDSLSELLEQHQVAVLKENSVMDQVCEQNTSYHKMLMLYIDAGKKRLFREWETTLANMREIAKRTEITQDVMAAKQFEEKCLQFGQRLRYLENFAGEAIGICSQLRIVQQCNEHLSEGIHNSIVNVIPAWKERVLPLLDSLKSTDWESEEMHDLLEANDMLADELDVILQIQADGKQQRDQAEAEILRIELELKQM